MKPFLKSALAATLLSSSFLAANVAAEQKIGVVNVQGVLQNMPQAVDIQKSIEEEFKEQAAEVKRLESDIRFYIEDLQRNAATKSEDEKKALQEKILTTRQEYEEKAQALRAQSQRRMNEETDKLLGFIKQSIDVISAEEKFDVVLNANAVAFITPDADLSEKVLEHASKIK